MKQVHRLLETQWRPGNVMVLHFERKGYPFVPGQFAVLRDPATGDAREYSIYSAAQEDRLSFLIRHVKDGAFTGCLSRLKAGSERQIEGPWGCFTVDRRALGGSPLLLVATGTGIAPFRSYVTSIPGLNYTVLHGVRRSCEVFGKEDFSRERYIMCVSGDKHGDYSGRVTGYLRQHPVASSAICCLCGNSAMIEEVTALLEKQGVPAENIFSEAFF